MRNLRKTKKRTSLSFWRIVREVVTDPGVGFLTTNTLFFASQGALAVLACLGATLAGMTCKTMSIVKPRFLDKTPALKKILTDPRTSLHVAATALLSVSASSLLAGELLPAFTSFMFAMCNMLIAESITKTIRNGGRLPLPDFKNLPFKAMVSALTLRNVDFYIACGFSGAGLMIGGIAFAVLPLVAASYVVSVTNRLFAKPEYHNHPKVITVTAALVFSYNGFAEGQLLMGLAYLLIACIYARIETLLTPGGAKQVAHDLGEIFHVAGKAGKPAPVTARHAPESSRKLRA